MDLFQREYEKIESEIPNGKIGHTFGALKETMKDRPLVLYGAGRLTGVFLDYCKQYGLRVSCVCDTYKTGVYEYGEDILNIINTQTLMRDYSDATVVVCSCSYNDEICASLKQNGFSPERIIPCPLHGPYLESLQAFNRRHKDGYSWAYHYFEEERSCQIVLNRMRMYLLEEVMQPNTSCDLYYEDGFIAFSENEIFVDAGAYNGNTTKEFIEKTQKAGRNYAKIYAFEPDIFSYKKAVSCFSAYTNVEIVQKGLWSTETELSFLENAKRASSSFVLGSGALSRVPVTSLDVFFQGKSDHELPTFIKMDVEGSEKEALLGAENIIRRIKPKLAICAYHKPEDIYELPQTILNIRNDYKLALRQHASAGYYDTVLYAV